MSKVLDVRDLITRFEELEGEREDYQERDLTEPLTESWAQANPDEAEELEQLESVLGELAGCGGDHQWRGDWYPTGLISEDYFVQYAQEFAEDIGAIPRGIGWPACHIDWDAAAEALQQDYSQVDYDGTTYYYRS